MPYRGDIEGLRGIAVLLVLLFHLEVPRFGAGFLGVDIFFVISGYLITQILLGELEAGRFSLIQFYRRRAVRILPALLTMIVLVSIAGALILLPPEIRSLGKSAAATAGFASNLYFWTSNGYFDLAEIKPLLNGWSLGVEEQFYLLYPLALFAAWRWARAWLAPLLWALTLGSLALSWLLTLDHPDAAFYLLPSRGWELGIGALAGAGGLPDVRGRAVRMALAVAGLVLMLGVTLYLPGAIQRFGVPAPAAIAPCAGAALLLAYGAGGPAAAGLSVAPLRWLGRISYSLYLWHFPILVLYKAGFDPAPGRVTLGALALASIAIGALSYRWIETPFRRRFRHGGDPRRIVAAGVAACATVALAGMALAYGANIVRPLPPKVERIMAYADYRGGAEFNRQFGPVECYAATRPYDLAHCLRPDPARYNIVVLGDSYAAHVWRAIAERFPGDKVMLASSGRCRPLVGATGGRLCLAMFDRVMREMIATRRVQAVVLSAHWRGELRLLAPTIRAIQAHGVHVLVVGPIATFRQSAPRVIALAELKGDPSLAERERIPGVQKFDAMMREATESTGALYYSMFDAECPGGHCRLLTRDGAPFHFDEGHLTLSGARELVGAMPRP